VNRDCTAEREPGLGHPNLGRCFPSSNRTFWEFDSAKGISRQLSRLALSFRDGRDRTKGNRHFLQRRFRLTSGFPTTRELTTLLYTGPLGRSVKT
jgi:hypothetical protein